MEAHGSARLSRKRKREGSNGEAEEGQKPLKLKRCTVVSEMKVCTDERWYLSSKAVMLLAPQGLKYPAPYADQLESMEEKLYQRVTMEEARKGTRRLFASVANSSHTPIQIYTCSVLLPFTDHMTATRLIQWALYTVIARNNAYFYFNIFALFQHWIHTCISKQKG